MKDLQYGTGVEAFPELDSHFQSSVGGLYIVGAAGGSPLLKTSLNEGVEVVRHLAESLTPGTDGVIDLVIIGAGPAGLAAALEARRHGFSTLILEQRRPLNTIRNFPAGKHVYAEPATIAALGDLPLDDATKEELLARWRPFCEELEILTGQDVTDIQGDGQGFEIVTAEGRRFAGRRVILAVGRMGNPRKLGVPGEDLECVYNSLLNPGKYQDMDLVVVGGGNSAVEAALSLAGANHVVLAYRGAEFSRISRANQQLLDRSRRDAGLRILLNARPTAFRPGEVDFEVAGQLQTVPGDAAFVLIGSDPPLALFKRLGVALEGRWSMKVLPRLLGIFALVYALYGTKFGLWPFRSTYHWLQGVGARPDMLYGVLYTVLVSVFGARAWYKYRKDSYQRMRFVSLVASQWLIYFLLPWSLYFLGYTQWWRTWTVSLPYPLAYYGLWEPAGTLFQGTALPWAVASLVTFLLVMPVVSYYHGKRFCAWVCPCGALAETVGDLWRHRAPRGHGVRRVESLETVILVLTVLASIIIVSGYRAFLDPGRIQNIYKAVVDISLASVIAITAYPFLGGRIWCRFACPLSKWMELWARWTGGRLAIVSNSECISCGECTRYCQMGIDVRAFAQREQPLSNLTTSCVFCGICVTVCPVDVLQVQRGDRPSNDKGQ